MTTQKTRDQQYWGWEFPTKINNRDVLAFVPKKPDVSEVPMQGYALCLYDVGTTSAGSYREYVVWHVGCEGEGKPWFAQSGFYTRDLVKADRNMHDRPKF